MVLVLLGKNYISRNLAFSLRAFDIYAILIIALLCSWLIYSIDLMDEPINYIIENQIDLSTNKLLKYSLLTGMRMCIAAAISVTFAVMFGMIAAKYKAAEKILIPFLDILQSVPILGYISFTIVFFMSIFPNNQLGIECAAIFAIFTSQAWNMAFSVYQSTKTIPKEIEEVGKVFNLSKWQYFWRINVPFILPGLAWNLVISVSAGWFFIVASESITFGNEKFKLPGIGAYIDTAIEQKNMTAIIYSIVIMCIMIMISNHLIFKPLLSYASRFKYESANSVSENIGIMEHVINNAKIFQKISLILNQASRKFIYNKTLNNFFSSSTSVQYGIKGSSFSLNLFFIAATALITFPVIKIYSDISLEQIIDLFYLTFLTLLRVIGFLIIVTIIWIPIGVYIGLNKKLSRFAEPIAQFLSAFPANLLFPVAAIVIGKFNLNPSIWLGMIMILGAQWYVLFNVVAGTTSIPQELLDTAKVFKIKNLLWWKKIILPVISPYIVTGAVATYGGAFNACIVAETIFWGDLKISTPGIGSYIAEETVKGNVKNVALGVIVMTIVVVIVNRMIWNKLYDYTFKITNQG